MGPPRQGRSIDQASYQSDFGPAGEWFLLFRPATEAQALALMASRSAAISSGTSWFGTGRLKK